MIRCEGVCVAVQVQGAAQQVPYVCRLLEQHGMAVWCSEGEGRKDGIAQPLLFSVLGEERGVHEELRGGRRLMVWVRDCVHDLNTVQ